MLRFFTSSSAELLVPKLQLGSAMRRGRAFVTRNLSRRCGVSLSNHGSECVGSQAGAWEPETAQHQKSRCGSPPGNGKRKTAIKASAARQCGSRPRTIVWWYPSHGAGGGLVAVDVDAASAPADGPCTESIHAVRGKYPVGNKTASIGSSTSRPHRGGLFWRHGGRRTDRRPSCKRSFLSVCKAANVRN